MKLRAAFLLQIVLVGCATGVAPPPPTAVPTEWAQKNEEVGKLPVGRVTGVELKRFTNHYSRDALSMVMPVYGLIVPVVVPTLEGIKYGNKEQQYYLYSVRQKGANELSKWGEYVVYPVGACVALRLEPYLMIVPAVESECE